jgi:uncharacterized membrane protein
MNLAPFLETSLAIKVHVFLATGTILLGAVQLLAPKGTIPHRTVGWTWVVFMAGMLITAFVNRGLITWDPFSPAICCRAGDAGCDPRMLKCGAVHMITVYTFLCLPYAALQARLSARHHRYAMIGLLLLMVIGGIGTLEPPRIMHTVFFGQPAVVAKVKDRLPETDQAAITGNIAAPEAERSAAMPSGDPAAARYSEIPAPPR